MFGGANSDRVFGGSGIDRAYGGSGDDYVGGDDDLLSGGLGADNVVAGECGNVTAYGDDGDDVIDARDGCSYIPEQMPEVIRDTVYCGPGHDTVYTDNDGDGRLEYGEDRVSGCERVILAPQSPPEEEGT